MDVSERVRERAKERVRERAKERVRERVKERVHHVRVVVEHVLALVLADVPHVLDVVALVLGHVKMDA